MISALGMYDPIWLRGANDALWQALGRRLAAMGIADVPLRLTRDRPLDAVWMAPDLLLAQTCGYPLTARLGAAVTLVATPVYRAPGCEGAWHRSALVVRHDDPAQAPTHLFGRRAAINARDSNTGMNLLRASVAPHALGGRFFANVIETGAHARSLMAVIANRADLAAIDAVTLALLCDRYPALNRRIRVLDWTAATPGLPLVTSADQPAATLAALRRALTDVMADPALAEVRAALRLAGMAVLDRRAYDIVPRLEREAIAIGYPQLA
jgi:ABC-type phosphate/phosphonate transport system substrate-binding protein